MKASLIFMCAVLLISLLLSVGGLAYALGKQSVQKEWDKQSTTYAMQLKTLQDKLKQEQADYNTKTEELSHDLSMAEQAHADRIAAVRAEYGQRLHDSESRAAIYQRQAAAGSTTCADLAGHAAELDRSLAEGVGLVEELRRTLELRDAQNRALGQQIRNERSFLEAPAATVVPPATTP